MQYVIIGNSAAAIGAVEGIRLFDKESEILIIASEPYPTYSRPLISYFLGGKADEKKMQYRDEGFYERNRCKTMLGTTVLAIDAKKKTVQIEDGKKIAYDKLLLATGSSPLIPPLPGLKEVKECFTFLTYDDAKALKQALTPDKRVLILGAGLIGLKCAEGIGKNAASVTCVDRAPQILPSILDAEGAALVRSQLEEEGIRFCLGQEITALKGNSAVLSGGETLEFDILVIAVGCKPNVELFKKAGGTVDRGILIDENGATSIKDVFAAGDCAQGYDLSTSCQRVLALLPNGYMQGEAAGIKMAGAAKPFQKGMAMNAIGLFGCHILSAGVYEGEARRSKEEIVYKKLFIKDNRLKGFILINQPERAGIYTSLIREQVPLDTIDFEMILERPQLMAFSPRERAKKLGGATV